MTREELGNVLSAQMQTRTLKDSQTEDREIDETWEVRYMETDKHGVLNIYCIYPNEKK